MLLGPAIGRKGFSLVEAIMVVLFIGILSAIAVPRLNLAVVSKYKAEATAKKIVVDLRRVRGLAIANAATNTVGYSMAMNGDVLADFRTLFRIRNLDTAELLDEHMFDPDVTVWSDRKGIRFGPLGNLLESGGGGYPTEIRVSAEGKIFTIGFVIATGTITCDEN